MSELEEYNATVLDHFMNPRNTGEIPEASASGTVQNPLCGDMVKLTLRIEDGVVREARMKTFGCAAAIASASVLTELLTGRTVAEARAIRTTEIVARLGGLPEHKILCSVVAEEAVARTLPAAGA
jgi:nitrogen fixation NifU-like protein